LDINKVKHYF